MVYSQQSIDAFNLYGQLLLNKDIASGLFLFITILQNKQKVTTFVTIDSWNSIWIDIIVKARKFM